MSILLVGLPQDVGAALADRLLAAGDEVRALEPDPARIAGWKGRGVHVASGAADDDDLVFRAATNVRTLVLGPHSGDAEAVLRGAAAAAVGRVVACMPEPRGELVRALRDSGSEFIVLRLGKPSPLGRRRLDPLLVAEAIDAADDLAGEPRMELDLTEASGWTRLRLAPPES